MNKTRFIISFAVAHLILSVGLMVEGFSMGMRRFDSAAPASAIENVLEVLVAILWMPIAYPFIHLAKYWKSLGPIFSGLLGYIPIFLNSLVWGFTAWWVYSLIVRKQQRSAV